MKKKTLNIIREFWKNEHGATAIEYGLIAALIAVGMIVGATKLGKVVNVHIECTGHSLDKTHLFKWEGSHSKCVQITSSE